MALALGARTVPDTVKSIEDVPKSVIGITGKSGVLRFGRVIQQNPYWIFPMIGRYKFRNEELFVYYEGVETLVSLADLYPDWAFREQVGRAVVRLQVR